MDMKLAAESRSKWIRDMDLGALDIFIENINKATDALEGRIDDRNSSSDKYISASIESLLQSIFELVKFSLFQENKVRGASIKSSSELYDSYPLLKEQVSISINQWVNNTATVWNKWKRDKAEIQADIFESSHIGDLTGYSLQQGDRHNHGQQTLLLELSCGNKIAYKPRNAKVESTFYVFARALGFHSFYEPTYILKDDYTWMEYIPYQPCKSADDVKTFYYQTGLLLSLMYLLEAEDIHAENLIACGSNPVIVDLETLFHHNQDSVKLSSSECQHNSGAMHTVLKTFMLPYSPEFSVPDTISAISRFPSENSNLPKLNNKTIGITGYIDDLIEGFSDGYQQILTHKERLLSRTSPLHLFNDCTARYVPRRTETYTKILSALYHPNNLKSDKTRSQLLEYLSRSLSYFKHYQALFLSEKESLLRGDVPYFTFSLNNKSLKTTSSNKIDHYFQKSGIEIVKHKLLRLSQHDLLQQIKIIQQSIEPVNTTLINSFTKSSNDAKDCINDKITTITALFKTQKIHLEAGYNWPTYITDLQIGSQLRYSDPSVYAGQSGILFALMHLHHHQPIFDEHDTFINASIDALSIRKNSAIYHLEDIGFSGLAGILFINATFQKLYPENVEIADSIDLIAKRLYQQIDVCREVDIIDGMAGIILSLLAAYQMGQNNTCLSIAKAFGHKLVSILSVQEHGKWRTSQNKTLYGFAHGLSGIGHALIKLHHFTQDTLFFDFGMLLLQYESQMFSEELNNWPDIRYDDAAQQHSKAMTAWCHGAVGIGMSRVLLCKYLGDTAPSFIHLDIQRALAHLSANSSVKKHGLCHGNQGNFELLNLCYQDKLVTKTQFEQSQNILTTQLEDLFSHDANTPNENRVMTLSLMNGWSGIAYQLLRLIAPDTSPTLLMLEP
jgi:lantibiotic modifying enzyme